MSTPYIFRAFILVLLGAPCLKASAQTAPTTDLGQVKITDRRNDDTQERRESTVSKIVIGREEIEKMGDSTIGDVLKRQSGISIDGAPGRGSGVRMRGLSVGYTQILLDGQRVPPGFSIESLTPEMVERIEIYRAPTAETGTRAVAGTINIITREGHRGEPGDLKLGGSWQGGDWSPTLALSKFHDHGDFTANYTLNAFRNELPNYSDSTLLRTDAGAVNSLSRETVSASQTRREGFNTTARLQFKGDPGETFTLMPFFMYANVYTPGKIQATQTGTGTYPSGADNLSTVAQGYYWVARLNGQWKKRLDKDSNVEAKFNAGGWQSQNDSSQVAQTGTILPTSSLNNVLSDVSYTGNLKYSRILAGGHQWVSGSELENINRSETSLSTPSYSGGSTNMSATQQRYALYTQDEWQLTPQWATYVGLRFEHLLTDGNNGLMQAQNTSSVLSPLLHTLWKLNPESKDQVRWSLTRSYKAPNLNSLMATYVRTTADTSNGPTTADSMGNPNLKPELATGMDLAFERYLPQGGVLSTSVFYRHIDNLTRSVVSQQSINGVSRWVSTPENIGSANTEGVELEAKFRLDQWVNGAPKIDVRSNLSFYNSQVDGIIGPDNRLDQQPHMTGNVGADYKLRDVPLTVGGNLNITPAYLTQTSNAQLLSVSQKRVIDLYGLWKIDPKTAWRLSVNNLSPLNYTTGNVYSATGVTDNSSTLNRSYVNIQLRWEKKI